jgi:hypothetical protein
MFRNKTHDEQLSLELKNPVFAREFLLAQTEGEDGLTVDEALRYMISKMGVKEFSEMAKVEPNNVSAFVQKKRDPKPGTLDIYLKPFGLKTKLIVESAS